jgi:hypothetical protein
LTAASTVASRTMAVVGLTTAWPRSKEQQCDGGRQQVATPFLALDPWRRWPRAWPTGSRSARPCQRQGDSPPSVMLLYPGLAIT